MWRQALRTRIAAVTGAQPHWGIAPQTTPLPYTVINVISDDRDQHFQGFQGLRGSRVQIDIYGAAVGEVVALTELVIAAVSDGGEFSGVRFERIADLTVRDLGAETDTGFVHRQSIDARFWHD